MKNHVIKLIVCVVLISCLMVGFCTTSHADALSTGASLLSGALKAVGVDLAAGTGATVAMLDAWLNNGYSISGTLTGVADGYIKVRDDSVVIDGVEYQSIFLNPDMAQILHTQAFDFVTQHAISSNSSGILASGTGYFDGVPVFSVNGVLRTQDYVMNEPGEYDYSNTYLLNVYKQYTSRPDTQLKYKTKNAVTWNNISTLADQLPFHFVFIEEQPNTGVFRAWYSSSIQSLRNTSLSVSGLYVSNPFEYDYVAGQIDASPLPEDYGFSVLVPSAQLEQAGIIVGTYPVDGGTGTDAILEILSLLDELNAQNEILNPEFIDEDTPPVPPQPVDTPLGEVPYSEFVDTFGQSITDGLQDVNDTIGLYGEDIIDTVDTVGQSITDELQNVGEVVDTVGQSIVDELENVETGIDTLGQTLTDALDEAIDNVLEAVDSIATTLEDVIEAIMTHPLDLFSNFLDRLANIPIIKTTFDGIKQHVGIWHYVVEWFTCVGGFLGFMIGVFSDTAYCMVVPIYACVAAAICLAFYKRFGR